jgi:hypothetical protein
MAPRRVRLAPAAFALAALSLAAVPGVASAHAVGASRFDAPIPLSLLFAGAGTTVALTALWLGRGERTLPEASRPLATVPERVARPLAAGARALFGLAVVASVLHGVLGRAVPAENAATLFVWPVWFRGVALLALLVGNPWPVLSPWRALYDALVELEGERIALREYPERLGAWPATLGFVSLFGIAENLSAVPRSPRLTAGLVAVYALAMVAGAVCFGPVWFRRADPLGVLYRLFGRVAALATERTAKGVRIDARPPWRGCSGPLRDGATLVFVVAAVYTVSFDGFTSTSAFGGLLYGTRDLLGTGRLTGVLLYCLGLAGFVLAFVLVCRAAERLGGGTGRGARAFAPTVLPIAAAYEVAHNYPYVLRSLGALVGVALEALRAGAGTAFDPLWWLPLPAFWGSQALLIVAGHLLAVVAAHRVAVGRYGARAGRAHLPLAALMVGYTVLSLWIVSQPVVAP